MSSFDLKRFLNELEELVNTDSGSRDPEGVKKVGEIMAAKFEKLGGWTVRRAAEAKTAAPCLEIFNKDGSSFDVLLLGHIDTVFPKGTAEKRPYSEKDGRVYGPGSYDMKASVLMAYYALKTLQEEGGLDDMSVCLGLNAEEELGSVNAREWIEKTAAKSRFVMVCEPPRKNGEMVLERKGLGRFKIEIEGKAVHAGINPWDGVSAIMILAKWTLELHAMNDYKKGTSLNMGLFNGGIGVNTVAGSAVGELDVRADDPAEFGRIEEKIEELKKWTAEQGASAIVSGGMTRPVMRAGERSLEFKKLVDEAAARLGIDPKWMKTGGGSDANFAGAMGIATLDGFGPVGGLSHTENEYLEIDTIEPRLALMTDVIRAIGKKLRGR